MIASLPITQIHRARLRPARAESAPVSRQTDRLNKDIWWNSIDSMIDCLSMTHDVISFLRPSLEEAKTWAQNFERLLRNKFGVQMFQDFLRSQYGEENLNFWLAVEEYKSAEREARADMARLIYEDYVSTLSPTEVRLSRFAVVTRKQQLEAGVDLFRALSKA